MATNIVLPKLGNSVESCLIVGWKVAIGDTVAIDDVICEVETDKAVMEVPSTAAGTVLARFVEIGDEVAVMAPLVAVGMPGEALETEDGAGRKDAGVGAFDARDAAGAKAPELQETQEAEERRTVQMRGHAVLASPRARGLAAEHGLDVASLAGSGPGGRVIERDVTAALHSEPPIPEMSPVAQAMVTRGGYSAPAQGSGPGGRVMKDDLADAAGLRAEVSDPALPPAGTQQADGYTAIPLRGVRKVIAERMLASRQTTAQLTLNRSADARALLSLRARLKESPEEFGLANVTINDLILLATARALRQHPEVNETFEHGEIRRFHAVHLGMAVDTERGLLVPVVRNAHALSLAALAAEAKRLAVAAVAGSLHPDEMSGGTCTVTNLGALGIESFTPLLNPPQVAILGVGSIALKPIATGGEVRHVSHIGLSLTINHQVVDGAPAARFLQTLARNLENIDLLALA